MGACEILTAEELDICDEMKLSTSPKTRHPVSGKQNLHQPQIPQLFGHEINILTRILSI